MYSPTTRLLAVLELLQSHSRLSGAEIARRLEVDVRTIRRYIVMLQDLGIPVEAERGPDGAYHLERGRRLPPLLFTDGEAIAITLGLLAIRTFQFPVNVAAVESALAKLERVLPENLLHQVRSLQEAITFNVSVGGLSAAAATQNDFVVMLSAAVVQFQRVHLVYSASGGNQSERDFDPYGIVYNDGYWYTVGYCHLRSDLRTFRLDRILALKLTEKTFDRPNDFDALKQLMSSITVTGSYEVEIVLQTSLEQAQTDFHSIIGTMELTDEGVIFRRMTSRLESVAYALLDLDYPVMIKQPAELHTVLRSIAAKALHMAGEQS